MICIRQRASVLEPAVSLVEPCGDTTPLSHTRGNRESEDGGWKMEDGKRASVVGRVTPCAPSRTPHSALPTPHS